MSSSSPNSVLSAAPARPVAQRGYATLVVALAAFLVAMAALRVPFRGYLVEARLAGRLEEGIAPADARQWLTEAACDMDIRLDSYPGGRCEVVVQQLAPRAGEAQLAIDRLAQRFVEQFVVERREGARQTRLARLQAELQTARDAEDTLRSRVEHLRQEQLAAIPREMPPVPAHVDAPPQPLDAADQHAEQRTERLESLRIELARLLASFTDQHPQVITLRAQIAQLESERPPSTATSGGETHIQHYEPVFDGNNPQGEADAALQRATADLLAATRTRQWAERQLQTGVESLAGAISMPWSVEPARVVVRVGGTPRALTLLGGGLVALIAGSLMFAGAGALVPRAKIQNLDELTNTLTVPLATSTPIVVGPRAARRSWKISPWAAKGVLCLGELTLAAFLLALVFSMLADRTVASQVLVDPFGVQSEVVGRLFGA